MRLILALTLGVFAAGCSLFRPEPKPPPPVVKVEAPPKPELPKPIATHRFELDADSGDVVGYVQVSTCWKPRLSIAPQGGVSPGK